MPHRVTLLPLAYTNNSNRSFPFFHIPTRETVISNNFPRSEQNQGIHRHSFESSNHPRHPSKTNLPCVSVINENPWNNKKKKINNQSLPFIHRKVFDTPFRFDHCADKINDTRAERARERERKDSTEEGISFEWPRLGVPLPFFHQTEGHLSMAIQGFDR